MIPLLRPIVPSSKAAARYFKEARRSGVYSNFGPLHAELERNLTLMSHGGYALPIISGTAAIEVALRVSGLKPGARVLVPDFTHSGTLLAVVRAGMKPVLAGVCDETWILGANEVKQAFEAELIDGVVVVSPFGYYVDVENWEFLSRDSGLPIVYDFAGAFGNFPKTRNPIAYSFHATKNFGVGEGGMIVFSDPDQRDHARRLINFDTQADRSIASLDGGNMKMCELLAAYLLAALDEPQLRRLGDRIERKQATLDLYQEALPLAYAPKGQKYPSLCVLGHLPAQALEQASEDLGVTFKRYYPLLSSMQALAGVPRLSVSSAIMETCCALPCDVDVREALVVIRAVRVMMEEQQWDSSSILRLKRR